MSATRLLVVALVGLLLPTALMQSQRDLASTESTSKLPSTTSAVSKPAETTSGEEDILISIYNYIHVASVAPWFHLSPFTWQ